MLLILPKFRAATKKFENVEKSYKRIPQSRLNATAVGISLYKMEFFFFLLFVFFSAHSLLSLFVSCDHESWQHKQHARLSSSFLILSLETLSFASDKYNRKFICRSSKWSLMNECIWNFYWHLHDTSIEVDSITFVCCTSFWHQAECIFAHCYQYHVYNDVAQTAHELFHMLNSAKQ